MEKKESGWEAAYWGVEEILVRDFGGKTVLVKAMG